MFSGEDMSSIADRLASSYRVYGDHALSDEFLAAAKTLMETIPTILNGKASSDQQLVAHCKVLSCAIARYSIDGKKKKKPFLAGAYFQYEKSEIQNKVGTCQTNVMLYHLALMAGSIDARNCYSLRGKNRK